MTTPNDRSVERAALIAWLIERRDNCLRISLEKDATDRTGWIEDADYFNAAIRATLERAEVGSPANEMRIALVTAIDGLVSQIENTDYKLDGDSAAQRQADGACAHARKVAEPYRYNGPYRGRAEVGSVVPETPEQFVADRPLRELVSQWLRETLGGVEADNVGKPEFTSLVALARSGYRLAETQRSSHTAGSDEPKAESGSTQAGREPLTDEQIENAFERGAESAIKFHAPTFWEVGGEIHKSAFIAAFRRALAPSSTSPEDRSA